MGLNRLGQNGTVAQICRLNGSRPNGMLPFSAPLFCTAFIKNSGFVVKVYMGQ